MTDAPVLKQVKALGGVLKDKAQKFYKALEGRYGPTQAKLIMASGTALDLGITGVGALHGVPIYIPGMSILGSLPAVAMAETYLQAKRLLSSRESEGEPPVLSPKEIQAQARKLVSELVGAHVEYLKANRLAKFSVMEALDVPDVRQKDDSSCGLACFRAVLKYYGVQEQQGLTHPDGLKPAEISALIRAHGLYCLEGRFGMDELTHDVLDLKRPVICPIQAGSPDGQSSGHYVVVRGVEGGLVYFHDPIDGLQELSVGEFTKRWHDVDRDGKEYKEYGISVWK